MSRFIEVVRDCDWQLLVNGEVVLQQPAQHTVAAVARYLLGQTPDGSPESELAAKIREQLGKSAA